MIWVGASGFSGGCLRKGLHDGSEAPVRFPCSRAMICPFPDHSLVAEYPSPNKVDLWSYSKVIHRLPTQPL